MNTKYCANCGRPNHYAAMEPEKCSNCGSQFNVQFAPKRQSVSQNKRKIPVEAYEEHDDSDLNHIDFDSVDLVSNTGAPRIPDGIEQKEKVKILNQFRGAVSFKELAYDKNKSEGSGRTIKKLTKVEQQAELNQFLDKAKGPAKRIDIEDNGPE